MKRYYVTMLLIIVGLFSSTAISQSTDVLPKGLTEAEKGLLTDFRFTSAQRTPPPTGPVRTMAEWEEVEYLVVTWEPNFENILRQIVAVGVEECQVIITTQNQASVQSYLQSNGIDLTNVTFMNENWDSIWIRDYAGNTVYSDDVGERALVDWIYNRPRPNDDVMPSSHASLLGLPIYITNSGTNDLVNTGGNFMSDGLGNAFASELILDENDAGNPYGVTAKSEAEIDAIMEAYMGIDSYIKMPVLPFDAIHHIDMHMKLLDEETLLVSEYPEGVADGPQIQANIDYVLNNFVSPFGTPYDVKWIPAPPSSSGNYPDSGGSYRTFTNAIFINKSVLVPTYRPEVDDPALAQWEAMLPGYNIVGIDVDNPGENLISLFGAIHCITHTIGVSDPLWIVHQKITEANEGTTVPVAATIKHNSGIAEASMFWREVGQTDYAEVPMSLDTGDTWAVDFSVPVDSEDIEYYIRAEANSGKTINRPIVAPEGYWTMNTESFSVTDWAEQHISGAYPNPTTGKVNFELNQINGPVTVRVSNILGQQLAEYPVETANGTFTITLQDDWKGTLFVQFSGAFGSITKKVIKL
tara:strand:+ start:26036 stop:27781 length:1746 start_codon:yes stop_codon:yes gene_type:complete